MSEPEIPEQMPESRVKTTKIDAIRQLVQMMKDNELTALDFIDGSTQIRLRRRGQEIAGGPTYAPPAGSASPPPPQPMPPSIPASPSPPAPTSTGPVIESPMVGTFYSSNSPDAPSFVSIGSSVKAETTVCIIEAMKVFTDIPAGSIIPAGTSGTITEILVKNGQAVEYGQPLFRVKLA